MISEVNSMGWHTSSIRLISALGRRYVPVGSNFFSSIVERLSVHSLTQSSGHKSTTISRSGSDLAVGSPDNSNADLLVSS